MVRLAISVEGQTEENFVNKLLVPHFIALDIHVTPILIGGRGGDVSLDRARKDINKLASSFDRVTTLYDFYGFKGKTDDDVKSSLEDRILKEVSADLKHKVIPYIQMYEFEGLLFSCPDIFDDHLNGEKLVDWGLKILRQFGNNPERINDSQQTAPSKRLQLRTNYVKTIHGPAICQDIGLETIRSLCPGFNEWLQTLESLH